MKRIISILLCTLITISLFTYSGVNISTANAATDDEYMYPEAPLFLEDIDADYWGFELVSESDKLALYVIESTVNIAVLNKKSGMIWSSLITETAFETEGENKSLGRFYSLFSVGDIGASASGVTLSETFSNSIITTEVREEDKYDNNSVANSYMKVDYAAVLNGVRITSFMADVKYKLMIYIYIYK